MSGVQVYRNLIRSAGIAFKGDTHVLGAARQEIRRNFDAARDVTEEEKLAKLQHAEEVAKVLRMNVVQGKRVEGDTFDLRIHKDIELGDNESIRKAKQAPGIGQGCKQ